MFRPIFRRTLSAVLSIALLLTTISAAFSFTAFAGVQATAATDAADVIFLVPEAIYLQPTWNSYYQAQQMPFQIYVNNTLDSSGKVVCSTQENTQGSITFSYAGTNSAQISFEWMNGSGTALYDGSIRFGDSIDRTAGMAYTASSSAADTIAITAGTSPTIEAGQTGIYLKWTAAFTDNADGREKTAVAYTYIYKPYVAPVGSVIRVKNTRGAYDAASFGSNISWVCGVHGITGDQGEYYANTTLSSNGKGLLPISSSVPNGEQVGTEGLYAQLASANANESRFFHDDIQDSEPEPTLWINQTTSPRYLPDATLNYVNNNYGTGTHLVGSHYYSYFSLVCSPTAALTVDSSRYVNLSQIPNLSVAMLVTDTRHTADGGAWFFSNYTGEPGTTYYNNQHNGTSSATELWDRYSASGVFASSGTYTEPVSDAKWQGTKYNGRWQKPISTSSASGTYYIGTGYFNRDTTNTGNYYGGHTIWNVAELRTNIQFYDKGSLRAAVQNAIGKSAILNSAFYDVTSVYWKNYENLYKAAAMALAKLDGTLSAVAVVNDASRTYTSPSDLASALNDAVDQLLAGNGRTSGTATQTNVGLYLQDNGKYKCVAIGTGETKETVSFQTYDRVVFTANDYTGFSFLGLAKSDFEQTFQVGAIVPLPTSFTTSAAGAVIDGSTVTYAHTDVSGTDTHGNLYYTYYYLVNSYSVRFNANGGNGTMADQSFLYGVAQNLTANTFERRAYAFAGWASSPSGSIQYGDEESVLNLVTENNGVLDLYAVWEPVTYTIQYDAQGGSPVGTSYTTNYTIESAIGLPDAVKPGYELTGWRANGAGNWGEMSYGVAASIPAGKYGNVLLTAQWRAISYTIAFNGNGATSGSMNSQTLFYEETRTLTANAFQRTGYAFAGWALEADATAAIFRDKASVSNLTTTADDTVTLYAVWTANAFEIVYNTDGGTITDETYPSTYTIAEAVQLPTQIEKAGYTFTGWKPAASVGNWDAQTSYNGLLTAGMYGSVTLNAQWSIRAFTVQYETAGGTITSDTYTTQYDIHSAVTLPAAQRNGYLLSGWVPNGAGNWGETLYTVGAVGAGKYGDVTMTAQWKGVTYLIAFDGNGSTGGMMYNQSVEYGSEAALTANAYVRNGYRFLGWSLSDAAMTAEYTDGGTVSNLGSAQGETVTLYAVWEAIGYTVTYEPMGGTITAEGTTGYTVTELLQLAEVTRTGYTFKGWTPASSVGAWQALVLYSGTLNAGFFGNVTLVAQWEKNVYAIRYDAAGGTMSGNYTTQYSVDTVITLPAVTRTGFAFDGWQADAAWNNELITGTTVPVGRTGDVVLRAVWAQRSYTIHFNASGGSGTMDDQVMQFDVEQPLTLNAFTRPGYTFDGWAVEAGGTSVYANGASVLNLGLVDNDTVQLYAVWKAITFTIRYDFTDAGGNMATSSVQMDNTVTLRGTIKTEATIDNIPFLFAGWAYTPSEAAAGNVAYENKAAFTLTSEVLSKATVDWTGSRPVITLYAVWVNVKVTLNGENGAVIDNERGLIYGVDTQINERILRERFLSINGYGSIEIDYGTYIGTGTTVRLLNAAGEEAATYTLVIFGDLDGDGALTLMDIVTIKGIMNGSIDYDQATQTF